MELVVAERVMPGRVTADQVTASIRDGGWCNDIYGVSHRGSLLAPDNRTLICIYGAPDAEAVRSAGRRLGAPAERVWSASLHGPVGPDPLTALPPAASDDSAGIVVVGRSFEQPVNFEELQAQEGAAAACLQTHRVRFRQSLLARDRRRMLCLYAAPDAEAVRHVQHQAGLPFDGLWTATICPA